MLTEQQKQQAIRRRNFEKHIADCEYCKAPVSDQPGGAPPLLCMSGSIMLSYFIRAIRGEL